jgi:hypothetical protein
LRAEIDRTLATLATPLEDGQPVRAAVGVVDVKEGDRDVIRYRSYWGRDGMRRREFFGPVFQWPKECIEFVETVNARGLS